MLKAAVVGLGWWGRQIVSSLAGSDRIRISWGTDADARAAAACCTENGLIRLDRFEDALAAPEIEAVILATPHGLHEQQVVAAVAAGKQVFCEKPLALSADGAERLLAACDERGIVLGVGHERRYEGALEALKQRVDAEELGTLLHVEINWSHDLFAGKPAAGWRQDPAQAPAGTLTALGVHMTDFMQTLAGPVAEVNARMAHRSPTFPAADIISIQITFASGATGYLCDIATTPFYQRISVFGDRGWAEATEVSNVDVPEPATLTWRGLDGEIHNRTYKHTNTVRANFHAWADAVAGRGAYRFTRDQKLHNVQILEAIVRSAATGTAQLVG